MAFTLSGLYLQTWRDATDTTNAALDLLLDTNKIDLYLSTLDTAAANYFETTAAYSNTSEVAEAAPGYDRDTKTLNGVTPTWAEGNDGQLKYSWTTAVSWAGATFTAAGMILHTAAANLPYVGVTFGGDYTATNGTFTITAHANGIFYIDLVP